MGSRSPDQITLRRVLVAAIVALVLGVAAVTLLEIDQSLAHQGNELPQESLTVTKWFAIAFGVAALLLWVLERFRSHVRITVGVVIALVVLIATPIAVAIAKPDDTPMTVAAFDARTGEQRWQHDVDLLYETSPVRSAGRGRIAMNGLAFRGRCDTRPERVTLDADDGRSMSSAVVGDETGPGRGVVATPFAVGDVRMDLTPPQPPSARFPRLEARDRDGRMLWSTLTEYSELSPVLYADRDVVALYLAETRPTSGDSDAGPGRVIGVFDAHTGTRRWTVVPSSYDTPVFGRDVVFAIETGFVVIHETHHGKVVSHFKLRTADSWNPDAQLAPSERLDTVAVVEGGARKLTLLEPTGEIRWTAALPRAMPFATLSALGDTVYVAGGGRLGYSCGGE